MDKLLTLEEAGKALRVSRSMVCRMTLRGQLPHIMIGRCKRIPEAALQEWVQANTKKEGR